MLESDIRAKDPERQAIADAVAAFKAKGGQPEVVPSHQIATYVPTWNNRNRAECEQRKAEKSSRAKPDPVATIEEQLKAETDEVRRRTDEILEIIERLRQKEAKK